MRLGGRLAAAIEVLQDMERRHRPVADALKDWGLSHRFAGAGDRAAIGNVVYDALRHKRSAAWLMGDDSPRGLGFGALLLEAETPGSLNAVLDGDKFAPAPLTADEIAGVTARRAGNMPDEVASDCPDWCIPLMREVFGGDWAMAGRALAERPPLDLRVNTLKAGRSAVLQELAETGAKPSRIAPNGINVAPIEGYGRHPNVQVEPAFMKGWFEVQDEGSQIVAELAGATGDMQVLDLCAGGGGKTLAMSAAMDNRGQIFAYDSEKQRLVPIFERLNRAGCRNVQVVSRAAELDSHKGTFDLVLVDAPCTGSGTWRRRPDAKWRLSQKQLDVRIGEQKAILDNASAYVKPGGRLVYITCSVFRSENEGQVDGFLGRHSGWEPDDHRDLWAKRFPGHADVAMIDKTGGIRLAPHVTGTDGFYFAALRRMA